MQAMPGSKLAAKAALAFLTLSAAAALAAVTPFAGRDAVGPDSEDEKRVWSQSREFAEAIRKSGLAYADPQVTAYVQSVMDRLFPEFGGSIRVQVLQATQLNAFAIPDGGIYVNLGLISRFQNEAQLATVLAHEGIHFTHRHGYQSQRSLKGNAAFASVTAMFGIPILPQLIAVSSIFGFSRELETEADKAGYQRLAGAGYDVRESPKVFEHLAREVKTEEIKEPFFFASHPRLQERIENLRKLSANAPPGGDGAARSDYARTMAKARVDNIESQLSMGRAKSVLLFLEDPESLGELPVHAQFYLGEAYRLRGAEGDGRRSEDAYLKAVAAAPEFAPSYRALGVHYLKQNQYSEAARNLSRYLELSPQAHDRAYVQHYLKIAETRQGASQ
jgi:predicted Zn-dependent protease